MNRSELEAVVLQSLEEVAPETDRAALDRSLPLRDQVELDSMDWLNFVIRLNERLGVSVPESDYPRLQTIEQWLDYLHPAIRQETP